MYEYELLYTVGIGFAFSFSLTLCCPLLLLLLLLSKKGIPPSGYQAANTQAAELAAQVTRNLELFCENEERSTFVPFPFPFESGGIHWNEDTLHFSPKGYSLLGESLAPIVSNVLRSLDEEEAAAAGGILSKT